MTTTKRQIQKKKDMFDNIRPLWTWGAPLGVNSLSRYSEFPVFPLVLQVKETPSAFVLLWINPWEV